MLCFKHMNDSDSYFLKIRLYYSIWVHSSLCLYDMLCSSLGAIHFDIWLVVIYFFETSYLLLILKCIVYYLGLSLIDILAVCFRCLLSCEKSNHFLVCFGYWVKNWKVKFDSWTLRFNLIVCSLQTYQLRNHEFNNRMLNEPKKIKSPWERIIN